jgi:hypothetical protein
VITVKVVALYSARPGGRLTVSDDKAAGLSSDPPSGKEDKDMTLEAFVPVDVEDSPAVAQFEAIIRAWKGEAVDPEAAIPMSPIGAADLDGSLSLGQADINIRMLCKCTRDTLFSAGCTWDCPVSWDACV